MAIAYPLELIHMVTTFPSQATTCPQGLHPSEHLPWEANHIHHLNRHQHDQLRLDRSIAMHLFLELRFQLVVLLLMPEHQLILTIIFRLQHFTSLLQLTLLRAKRSIKPRVAAVIAMPATFAYSFVAFLVLSIELRMLPQPKFHFRY